VLFVADDQLARDMLCPAIAAAGYSLVATAVPADVNELTSQFAAYDAVVIDADSPTLASPAFVSGIKEKRASSRAPLIAVSKNPTQRAARAASENGTTALVSKHDRQALLETLAYALDAAADAKDMEIAA
jgi:two-component system chemotaxis sensor kinase CheA